MRRLRPILRKFHRQNWYSRCLYSKGDSNLFSGHLGDIDSRLGVKDPIESQRHYLFPDLGDKKLGEAGSIEEVFDIYSKLDSGDYRQTCQAIATLFHLQKAFRNVLDISFNNLYIQYSALNKFNKVLHEETTFNDLVNNFHSTLPTVPLSVSAFTFLCLSRLGISFQGPLMNEMLLSFRNQFSEIDSESLSYISVGIRYTVNRDMVFEVRPRIWWVLYMIDALPSLRSHLEAVSTAEELNKITISVFSLRTAMSKDLLQLYLDKVREIILKAPSLEIDESTAQVLVKIASVVENIFSQDDNDFILKESDMIPKILYLLKNKLHLLRWIRLVRLSGLLHRIGEGSSVIREELLTALRSIYNDEVISNGSYSKLKVMTEILKLEKRTLPFDDWLSLTDMIIDKKDGPDFYFHVNDILQMSSNIDFMGKKEEQRFIEILGMACRSSNETDMLRFFGNFLVNKKYLPETLLNSPELHQVENEAVSRFKDSLNDTYIVSNFVSKFAYLLAYTDESNDIDSSCVQKFIKMGNQINTSNLYKLSFSLGNALKKRPLSKNMKAIERIVHNRIEDISSQALGGRETVMFLKALRRLSVVIRNEDTRSNIQSLIEALISDYPPSVELILSVTEFLNSGAGIPNSLGENVILNWIKFVVDNQLISESYDCIRGILALSHRMNVDVSQNEDFVALVHKSIYRNMAYQPSNSIIQMALALITHRSLSEELIQMIFSLEFMDKVDSELAKSSRSKGPVHSEGLRINLMRLNRASHLLHPEFQIPWFHQKFCQENNSSLSKKLRIHQNGPNRSASFENSIFDALIDIFEDVRLVGYGVFSPYFHFIPFEMTLEGDGTPIEAAKGLTFTAIRHSQQQLGLRKFALYPSYAGGHLGEFELQSRELQTLGYKVIVLEEKEWNSMKMSCDQSRASHLKCLMGL